MLFKFVKLREVIFVSILKRIILPFVSSNKLYFKEKGVFLWKKNPVFDRGNIYWFSHMIVEDVDWYLIIVSSMFEICTKY